MQSFGKGLFLRAFSVWALLVIFLFSCSSPPPTPIQSLSSPPKASVKNTISVSPKTLNSDNFSPFFKRFPAQQNIPVMKPAPYSTKAASNPDRCVTALGGEPTTIQGTMNLYLGFGSTNFGDPIPYGLNIFDGLNLRNGTDESKVSMNFRYFAFNSNGVYAGVYISDAPFPRLKTGQVYSVSLTDSDTVADARGYASGPSGASLTLSIGQNSLTALVSGTSKVSVDGYNRYYKTDFNANATTGIQTGPCAPVIDLTAAPKLIQPTENSRFTITPENTQIPWVLEVTGPEGYFQTHEDTGNSTNEYLLQGPLPAGDYHAVAYYKAYPEYKARVTVLVRPKIELSASPTRINPISENPDNNKAIISVKPQSLTLPWTLTIDQPDGSQLKTYSGTGEKSHTLEGITPAGTALADGEYPLYVSYDAFPQEGAPGNITVKSSRNLELSANPSALTVDGSEQIAEFVLDVQGSLLPWTLTLLHPDGFTSSITGSGNKNETLPQPLKAGVYTATAQFDGYPETLKTAAMTVTIPPFPTPTPPVVTPTPPVVTPTPPVVTPTPPVVTPTPPVVTPTPPVVTPTPSPSTSSSITPSPSASPTPLPTTSPSSKDENGCGNQVGALYESLGTQGFDAKNLTWNIVGERDCLNQLAAAALNITESNNSFSIQRNANGMKYIAPPGGNRKETLTFITRNGTKETVFMKYGIKKCFNSNDKICNGLVVKIFHEAKKVPPGWYKSEFEWNGDYLDDTGNVASDGFYKTFSTISAPANAWNYDVIRDDVEVSCSGYYQQTPKTLIGNDWLHILDRHYGFQQNATLKNLLTQYSKGQLSKGELKKQLKSLPPTFSGPEAEVGKGSIYPESLSDLTIYNAIVSIGNLSTSADTCRTSTSAAGETNFGLNGTRLNGININAFVKPNSQRIITGVPIEGGVDPVKFYTDPIVLQRFGLTPPTPKK
ncbi:MAG: hypothetical protein AB7I41_23685 [Candidatus Sericytochromatia bacterium]